MVKGEYGFLTRSLRIAFSYLKAWVSASHFSACQDDVMEHASVC